MSPAPPSTLDRFLAAEPSARVSLLSDRESFLALAEAIEAEISQDATRVVQASDALSELAAEDVLMPRILRATVTALAYLGRHEQAIETSREARRRAMSLDDSSEAARALVAGMHPKCELGRVDEAVEDGELARRELLEIGAEDLVVRVDLNLGNIRKMQGDAARALEHLDRVIEVLSPDDPIRPHALNAVGECRHVLDDLVAADAAFEEAGRLLGEGGGLAAAIVVGNRADVAAREGRIEEALDLFKQAGDRCVALEAAGQAARLSVETGEALVTAGMVDEATEVLESSLRTLDELGMAAEAARARFCLARIDLVSKRFERSIERAADAARGFESLGNLRSEARALLLSVEAAIGRGDAEGARDRLRTISLEVGIDPVLDLGREALRSEMDALEDRWSEAVGAAERSLAIAEDLGIVTLVIECRSRLSRMQLGAGRIEESIDTARAAVEAIERIRAGFNASRLRSGFLASRTAAYESLVAGLVARGDGDATREAFEVMERARHRGLVARIVEGLPPEEATDAESEAATELRRRLLALYAAMDDEGPESQRRARNDGRQSEIDQLEIRLDRLLLEVEARRPSIEAVMDFEAVAAELPPGVALVEYFVADGRLIAFTVLDGALEVVPLDATLEDLSSLVTELHFQCRRRLRGTPGPRVAQRMQDACESVLRDLHDRIVTPLPEAVREAGRWLVVPHGPLVAVPFHALKTSDGHLLDHVVITTATSAAMAVRLSRMSLHGDGVLVATVSDDRAPSIREEGDCIASLHESVQRLDGVGAGSASVLSGLESARVAHLACHGRFLPGSPRSSGLRLFDRWITIRDIRELKRTPSVVVLSGCETGLHPQQGANELLGLSRAFMAGGTRTMVSSLWSVHDAASTRLMSAMHAAIASLSDDREFSLGPALHAAQLAVRSEHPHPAYWAPFFCSEPSIALPQPEMSGVVEENGTNRGSKRDSPNV